MKKTIKVLTILVLLLTVIFSVSCSTKETTRAAVFIDLTQKPDNIDEAYSYLYDLTEVDRCESNCNLEGGEWNYLAHPDSVLLNKGTDNEVIWTAYVHGHGKGPILVKTSSDGGLTYSERKTTPNSWLYSEETPTIYELNFKNGDKKHILISANPKWGKNGVNVFENYDHGNGFNASISLDNCKTWSEFKTFYEYGSDGYVAAIVAMSSLTQLKENGEFVDKWMGLFHDASFKLYKSILTFDVDGNMQWSKPEEYLSNSKKGLSSSQRSIAKKNKLCEVEVIRSDNGLGDKLVMIARNNTHKSNSMMAFSYDEGESWTELKYVPDSLNGDRHKAEYCTDNSGRILITYRDIINKTTSVGSISSRGWCAWVGTFEDLEKWYNGDTSSTGQYEIRLAHIYSEDVTSYGEYSDSDTGYSGNVCLKDGTFVIDTYGEFDKSGQTYIASKRINLNDIDNLVKQIK